MDWIRGRDICWECMEEIKQEIFKLIPEEKHDKPLHYKKIVQVDLYKRSTQWPGIFPTIKHILFGE